MSPGSRGVPLHTRSLSVVLHEGQGDGLAFEGYVIDLRKRGVVPVGGDLQGPGIIHQMHLAGTVDRKTQCYGEVETKMPRVAFEASPGTGGESCRDTIGNIQHLSGVNVSQDHARRVSEEIGGARGCSHIFTLTHLLGPTLAWAMAQEARHRQPGSRRVGERIFRRDVTIDGFLEGENLNLVAQLNDLHLSEAQRCTITTDLLREQREVRIQCRLALADRISRNFSIEQRLRTSETLDQTDWDVAADVASALEGLGLGPGVSARLLAMFADDPQRRPLRDTLLQLGPTVIQCFASCHDNWTQLGTSGVAESGGLPDSCYMWRSGGALTQRRLDGQ